MAAVDYEGLEAQHAEAERRRLANLVTDLDLLQGWDAEDWFVTPTWQLYEEITDELLHRLATTMGTTITVLPGCTCNTGTDCPWQ